MTGPLTPIARSAQLTLLASLFAYPLLFHFVTPSKPTPARFSQSREAISAAHCTLVTVLSLHELHRNSALWTSHPPPAAAATPSPASSSTLITTRSAFANAITALETGYLIQDAVILLLGARLRVKAKGTTGRLAKEINWRVLGWHHAGLSAALGVLQWYIARGREKGILVIVMLLLMNAS
ncbi:hypothetical protein BJ546DRAFT_982129 [Cryomyces antarcticus]|uniref:TLC domain-containing protein n=1 Tax=Cryomyces antarcticus TaxID=329879 RepID=A0ABR0KWJ7_9PEZI|nr:hypothetical protein LTR60_000121 [Cryomyces antarcticus]KAK5131780.1 hypothetical protein LTR16_000413 [Cryomyces antarcticus]